MKMKLIVSLLALCLALSIVSVQAQTNVFGNMEDIDIIMTGNVTETITCDIIGNAVIVEEMEFTDNMTNVSGNMTNDANIPENMTLDVTGKIILIRDLSNMTEKAVMIGKVDSIPGSVVIFGKTDKMTEGMTDATENMTDAANNMTNVSNNTTASRNITIITTGNMTGNIMLNTDQGMDNVSDMNNMTEDMDNMSVLMAGNMTGTVTGDMTRKMVVIKNIGDVAEISETIGNITETDMGMANMTEPMAYNLSGNMVIIRNMEDMPEIDDEDIDDLIAMDGNTALIGTMDNTAEMEEDMDEGVDNVTRKIVSVRSIDDMVRIVTWDVMYNITQNTVTIEDIGSLVEKMSNVTTGNMTNVTGNVTGNMTGNMTNVTAGNVTGNMTGNQTGNITGNMTGNQTGNMTGTMTKVPFMLESIEEIENDPENDVKWFVYINGEPAENDFGMNNVSEGDVISFWYTTEDDGGAVIENARYVANITVAGEAEEQGNENEDLIVLYDDTVDLTEGTFTFRPEGSDQEYEVNNFTDLGALNGSGLEFIASVMDNTTDDMFEADMNNDDMNGDTNGDTNDDTNGDTNEDMSENDNTNNDM
jgi:hypothetical protein